jgi:hypothetical protein
LGNPDIISLTLTLTLTLALTVALTLTLTLTPIRTLILTLILTLTSNPNPWAIFSENNRKFNENFNTWVFPLKNGGMLQRPYGIFFLKIFFIIFYLRPQRMLGQKIGTIVIIVPKLQR